MKIDNKEAQSGKLEDDWDFLPPKMINDPDAKKPDDWVDNPKMDDPEDTKPEVSKEINLCDYIKCCAQGLGETRIHPRSRCREA